MIQNKKSSGFEGNDQNTVPIADKRIQSKTKIPNKTAIKKPKK